MGRYRSLQSIMLAEALKGITDNQTITAYKKDCNRRRNPLNLQEMLQISIVRTKKNL